MDELETTIACLRVDSAFVALLQVVADVHEACAIESRAELSCLRIAWDESGEPVICNTDARDDCALAQVLKASFAENSELTYLVLCCLVRVWFWEHFSVVKENEFDTAHCTLVDTKSNFCIYIN